ALKHDRKCADRASCVSRRSSGGRISPAGGERTAAAFRHRAYDLANRNQRGNRLPSRPRSCRVKPSEIDNVAYDIVLPAHGVAHWVCPKWNFGKGVGRTFEPVAVLAE